MVVCLSIAEKVHTIQPIKVCDTDKIDILITELPPESPQLQSFVAMGIKVL
jgi:DeoR/GlpR family transcriptional regulator of sugar metabolism